MSNDIATKRKASAFAIEVPMKVSRPRVKSTYNPEPVYDDADEGHFVLESMSNTVFRTRDWIPGHRDDIIRFDPEKHGKDLKQLKIGSQVPPHIRSFLEHIVQQFWDVFAKDGLKKPMLD